MGHPFAGPGPELNCHKKYLELKRRWVHVLAQMVRLFSRSRTRSLLNGFRNEIYPALFVIRSQVLEP